MEKNSPKISICILTHNSGHTIKECLESIQKIDYPNFEIIIIDDNSQDETKKIVKETRKIGAKLIEINKKTKIGKLRNIAVQNSSGEFIAFTDSDCAVEKNWLKELLKGFSSKEIAGVGGSNLTPNNNSKFQKAVGEFYEFFSFLGADYVKNSQNITETRHNPSCNAMYKKNILLELNGFNESIESNEDPELDARIRKKGYKLMFNPKAIVFHHRKKNLSQFFAQAQWFGKGRIQAIKKNASMIQWFRLLPITFLLFIIASIISLNFGFFILLISMFFIFSFIIGGVIAVKQGLKNPLTYSILFILWFLAYGIGEIKGVFS